MYYHIVVVKMQQLQMTIWDFNQLHKTLDVIEFYFCLFLLFQRDDFDLVA